MSCRPPHLLSSAPSHILAGGNLVGSFGSIDNTATAGERIVRDSGTAWYDFRDGDHHDSDRDAYLKSIKPYIAYWQKAGMTEESRLRDWMACGGSRNGSFGINMQDRLPGESQGASENRQQTDFQRCLIRSSYRYTGNCSSDWAKTRPACGAP